MNNQKHEWTDEEETLCCYEYLRYSLANNELKDYKLLLEKLCKCLTDIKKNSIKMKLQNIKYLCQFNNIPDFVKIKPLNHPSRKNSNIFQLLIKSSEIKEMILLRKEDLQ